VLFQLYSQAATHLPTIIQPLAPTEPPKIYSDAKGMYTEYQAAKEELFKTFQKTGLGSWVRKPAELDHFELVA
jgi:double stranded RNA-specific editase B